MVNPERLLEELHRALDAEDREKAKRALERLRDEAPGGVERAWAELAWLEAQGEQAALLEQLERHVERWPDDADARHHLGSLLLELGRTADAIQHWLEVRALDEALDRDSGIGEAGDEAFILEVAERALARLPEPFSSRLGNVPILLEARPAPDLVEAGFDPRAYGLFEGPNHAQSSSVVDVLPLPSRIVLFVNNLVADFPDDDALEEQVEITIFHEIGHYFGLDEDDLTRLGLD